MAEFRDPAHGEVYWVLCRRTLALDYTTPISPLLPRLLRQLAQLGLKTKQGSDHYSKCFHFLGMIVTLRRLDTNLVLLLLLGGKLLLQVGPRLHGLPRLPVGDEQRFGKLREALVDVNLTGRNK